MKALTPLLAVLATVAFAALAGHVHAGLILLAVFVPYAAFAVFLIGFCYRVFRWAWAPVPFRIPTTCGQQKSLPWIKPASLDNPSTGWGAFRRMALEVLLFRSLFRNNRARLHDQRLVLGEDRYLWLGALAFHWSLLVILLRHLRLFLQPVPFIVTALSRLDGAFQVGVPAVYVSDVVILGALVYLTARRFRNPLVRYLSLPIDYLALFLLLGIVISGLFIRYVFPVDVAAIKQFALGLAVFHPVVPSTLPPTFLVHLLLASALAAYFPFSTLMHTGGVFLSPTRNLANNNRSRRHINPWNRPVKTHSYAEWEHEFRDKLKAAKLPIESEDAGQITVD
jgi:nitrate reductase gamma subunit